MHEPWRGRPLPHRTPPVGHYVRYAYAIRHTPAYVETPRDTEPHEMIAIWHIREPQKMAAWQRARPSILDSLYLLQRKQPTETMELTTNKQGERARNGHK